MKVYATTYTNKWNVEELDTGNMRALFDNKRAAVDRSGIIRNNRFYLTEEAARKYINKEYVPAREIVRVEHRQFD